MSRKKILTVLVFAVIFGVIFFQALVARVSYKFEAMDRTSTEAIKANLAWIDEACLVETENEQLAEKFQARKLSVGSNAWLKNQSLIIQQYLYAGKFDKSIAVLMELRSTLSQLEVDYESLDAYFTSMEAVINLNRAMDLCRNKQSIMAVKKHALIAENAYNKIFSTTKNINYSWLSSTSKSIYSNYSSQCLNLSEKPSSFKESSELLGVDFLTRAGGVITDDFNGDGYIDIVASSHALNEQLKIFLFDPLKNIFVDSTKQRGLEGFPGGLNIVQADYDNDGDIDLYISRGAWLNKNGEAPDSLLNNVGNAYFVDVTKQAGLYVEAPSQVAAWADYDNDGLLDLFVGYESQAQWTMGEKITPSEALGFGLYANRLYKNLGYGKFQDVAKVVGLDDISFTKGATWGDYNSDGYLDLYVSFFSGQNKLYKNVSKSNNNDRHFLNVAANMDITKPIFSFATWFWDYDQDGFEDVYVANFKVPIEDELQSLKGVRSIVGAGRLYKNIKGEKFEDVTKKAGLDYPMSAMGGNFGDVDNDGYPDMYIGTGSPSFEHWVPSRFFGNNKGKNFIEQTDAFELGNTNKGHGIAFADFDNDGDQDIYASFGGWFESDKAKNKLYLNEYSSNDWISLVLEGTASNRSAIGAKIIVTVITDTGAPRKIYHSVNSGGSFGANSLRAEIGLGKIKKIKSIELGWPNGIAGYETFKNVEHNAIYLIKEGAVEPRLLRFKKVTYGASS